MSVVIIDAVIFSGLLQCTYCYSICCCPWFPFFLRPTVVGKKYSNSVAIPLVNKSLIWWRHQMETFPALLALCVGNSPVTGEFPIQKPVTWSFDVFFDLRLNKRLTKQWWGWWFETPSRPLLRHCNVIDAILFLLFAGICVAANTKFRIGIVCQTPIYWLPCSSILGNCACLGSGVKLWNILQFTFAPH